ncbi:MFS transporter [Nocardia zapadnayensis]|nr:MFS transporter [Nocardia zapadnayensis]MCX0274210.1 MFS transporter [Nocardia zapadnayensis]
MGRLNDERARLGLDRVVVRDPFEPRQVETLTVGLSLLLAGMPQPLEVGLAGAVERLLELTEQVRGDGVEGARQLRDTLELWEARPGRDADGNVIGERDKRTGVLVRDGLACGPALAVMLNDLFHSVRSADPVLAQRVRAVGVPRVTAETPESDPAGLSFLFGGHARYVGQGVAGHRSIEARLFGAREGRPVTWEQRLANSGRAVVVFDAYTDVGDYGHAYLVVNHHGELLVLDPVQESYPVVFDPRRAAGVVSHSRVVEFDARGVAVDPIVTDLSESLGELPGQAPPRMPPLLGKPGPGDEDAPIPIRDLLHSNLPFRRVFAGNLATTLGTAVQASAVPLLTLQLTGSPAAAGWIAFATQTPGLLFGLPAGALADRWKLGRMMIASEAVGLLAAGAGSVAVATGAPELGFVLASTTFAEGTAATFYLAGNRAAVNAVVTEPERHPASRLIEAESYIASVGGRAVGPILLSVPWLPFAANTVSYAVNLKMLSRTRNDIPVRQQEGSANLTGMIRDVREGGRVIWNDATLRRLTIGSTVTNAAFAALSLRTAALVVDLPGWAQGAVLTGAALGGVVGAALPKALTDRGIGAMYPAALLGWTGLGVSMAASTNPVVLGAGAFGISVIGLGLNVSTRAYQMRTVPPEVYNSTSSAGSLLASSGAAVGGLAGGYLLAGLGAGTAGWIEAAALGAITAGALTGSVYQRLRQRFRPAASEPDHRISAESARQMTTAEDDSSVERSAAGDSQSGRGPAERAAAGRREGCIARVAQVLSALGSDEAREVEDGRKDWQALENAIAAQLARVEPTPHSSDRLAPVVEALRHRHEGKDTAVVVVEDDEKTHGYVMTNVDDTIVVFDTNIDDPQTRVRTFDRWRQSYLRIDEAFVAYFGDGDGTLSALQEPVPEHVDRPHPRHDIEGPPGRPADRDGTESDPEVSTTLPGSRTPNPAGPNDLASSDSLVHRARNDHGLLARLFGESVNMTGFWTTNTVTQLYFLQQVDPGTAGAIGWAVNLPYIGGVLISGHLADHGPLKKLLVISQLTGATGGSVAIVALAADSPYSVPILVGTTLLGAGASALYETAIYAALNRMIGKGGAQDGLTRFTMLNRQLTRVAGQGLAPILLKAGAWTGPATGVTANLVNLATLSGLPSFKPAAERNDGENAWVFMRKSIAGGWHAVQDRPILRRNNINLALTDFYLGLQSIQFPMLMSNAGLSVWDQGAVMSIGPLGAVVGSAVRKKWLATTSIDALLAARLAGLAGPAILQATTTDPWIAAAGFAATWAAFGTVGVPLTTYINNTTPDEVLGRARSISGVTSVGALSLGPAVAGGGIALLGHEATGASIALAFSASAGWYFYRWLFKGHKLLNCINQTYQAVWALGLDAGVKPRKWQKSPEHLRRAIATQLVKIDFDPRTEDPVTKTIYAVRNLEDGADTAVLLLDSGEKMHALTITNTDNKPGGHIVVFDTNITNPGDLHTDPGDPERVPRIRTIDEWDRTFPVKEAFVAFLTTDEQDNLTNLYPHDPSQEAPRKNGTVLGPTEDDGSQAHPRRDIEGPPAHSADGGDTSRSERPPDNRALPSATNPSVEAPGKSTSTEETNTTDVAKSGSLLRLAIADPRLGVRLGAESLNLSGIWVTNTVTSLYFLEHAGPGTAGAIGWAVQLPYIGGALIAGHLADHTPLKKLLVGSQIATATGGVVATAALASGSSYSIPLLVGTTMLGAGASTLYNSAIDKTLRQMVDDARRPGLVRYNTISNQLTRLLGQGLGPAVLAAGAWAAPLYAATTNVVNLASLSGLPPFESAAKRDDADNAWIFMRKSIAEGWHTIQDLPLRRRYNVNLGITDFYLGLQGLQFTSLVTSSGLPAWQQGAALLSIPVGAVIGSAVPKKWLATTSVDALLTARLAGLAGPAILQATTTDPWVSGAGFAVTWITIGSIGVPVIAYVNNTTPQEVFARVRSIGSVTSGSALALGSAVAGGGIALLGHEATGASIALAFSASAGWYFYRWLFKGHKLLNCINQTYQAVWALGLDAGVKPRKWQKSPEHLRRAIATQLVKIDFDPRTEDPVTKTIYAVRNLEDGADTAVLLLDSGEKMHALTITNTDNKPGGHIVVFDTNITNPGDLHTDPGDPERVPRIRIIEKWDGPEPVQEAFVAFLTTDEQDNLTNLYPHDPSQEAPRRNGKVLGPIEDHSSGEPGSVPSAEPLPADDGVFAQFFVKVRSALGRSRVEPPSAQKPPRPTPWSRTDRMTQEAVVVGRGAIDLALGRETPSSSPEDQPGKVEISVSEKAFTYLSRQSGWSARLAADGSSALLERGALIVSTEPGEGLSHSELAGHTRVTPDGVRFAGLPYEFARMHRNGSARDMAELNHIRHRLLDQSRGPLPDHVIAREIELVRSTLPDTLFENPSPAERAEVERAIRLAANGLHTTYTLYGGHPDLVRDGEIVENQIIGDLEQADHGTLATYHNGAGVLGDLRLLQKHLDNLTAQGVPITLQDRLDVMVAEVYSDAVYGNGRRSDNPKGFDELRSAALLEAHALASGYVPWRAKRLRKIVLGTTFRESTGIQAGREDLDYLVQAVAGIDLQTLSEPEAVMDSCRLAVEDNTSARYSPDLILSRAAREKGVRLRSFMEALEFIDAYPDLRPIMDESERSELTVKEAFAKRMLGNAGFMDPDSGKGYSYPPTWTLENVDMRRDHRDFLRSTATRLLEGPRTLDFLTAVEFYELTKEHAAEMRRKYHRGRQPWATRRPAMTGAKWP